MSPSAAAGVMEAGGVAVVLPPAAGITRERVSLVLSLAIVACLRPFFLSSSLATGGLLAPPFLPLLIVLSLW